MKTSTDSRNLFRSAWRACRLLNWGTLHFTFPPVMAESCRDAYEFRQREPMLPARRFKALGYYAKGKRC